MINWEWGYQQTCVMSTWEYLVFWSLNILWILCEKKKKRPSNFSFTGSVVVWVSGFAWMELQYVSRSENPFQREGFWECTEPTTTTIGPLGLSGSFTHPKRPWMSNVRMIQLSFVEYGTTIKLLLLLCICTSVYIYVTVVIVTMIISILVYHYYHYYYSLFIKSLADNNWI